MILILRNCLIVFAVVFSPLFAAVHKRSPVSKCRNRMDRGSPCPNGKKAQLSWFYDTETSVCLSFKYNGCGGNSNRFDSINSCEMNCIPPGFGACALNKEPFKNRNGRQRICTEPDGEKCPADYKCKRLASEGVCCPKKSEELFALNYGAVCSMGKTVKIDRGKRKSNLLGKSCEDDFCPVGSNCVQEEIFAHCCE